MARTKGTANLSGTIEPLAGGALDARSVVQTKADLTAINSFPYSYIGMETYVVAENKKYRLIGSDPTVLSNWEKEGGSADVTVYTPGGSLTFENLPVLSGSVLGYVYNVTNDFVTTSDFVEGAGKHCPAGTNVAVVATGTSVSPVYKFDASMVMIDLDDYQKKFQFAAMPTASEDLEGVILQYIGESTPNYTNGYFYKCVEGSTSGTYSWIEADSNYVKKSGDTMTGDLTTPKLTVGNRSSGSKGSYSATIGNGNVASGQSSFAVGLNNTAEELGAFAQGNANTATGAESFASGAHNNVSGDQSSAIGLYNTVSGDKATAIGSNLNVGYDYQVSIGSYNDNNEDNAFEIGHGYGNSSRHNIFEVNSSGDVSASGNITSGGEITDGEGNVLSEKQDEITGAATSIVDTDLNSDVVLVSDSNGKVAESDVSTTELGYLSGVTDYIQDQLDGKADESDLEYKQDTLQYDTMPTASADNVGDIVQFTGTTTASYTNGYFYKCQGSSGTYSWVQTNVQPSGGSGGDSETTEDVTSNIEVGGIPSGALIPTGTTLTAFVKRLLVKETAPTITVSSSESSVIEVGRSFGPTLTLNITGTGTGTPTSIKFYSGSTLIDTQAYVEGTNTYTYKYVDTTITKAMSITLKAVLEYTKSDGTSGTVEKSITHTFVYASYSGVVTTAPTTISEIRELTKNVKSGKGFTTTFNLSNQKACYCYPTSMGNLTSIKDANNFEYISSYTKTTVNGSSSGFTNYNVYTLTDPVTASGFKQVYA